VRCAVTNGVAIAVIIAAVACGNGVKKGQGTGNGSFPTNFTPGPALGNPPEPDVNKPGLRYLQKVYPSLRTAWTSFLENCRLRLPPNHALNDPKLVAVASVKLTRKGKLHAVRLTTASGNKDFDSAALEVARDASYPEAPAKFVSDDALVHLAWTFARDVRQASVAHASLVRVQWPIARAMKKFLDMGDRHTATVRLASSLSGVDLKNAQEAARVVGLGEKLTSAIILAALAHEETSIRRVGVEAASAAKLRAAVPTLRRLARGAADRLVRVGAIGALGRIGDAGSVALLTDILGGKSSVGSQRGGATLAAATSLRALGKGQVAESEIVSWLASKNPGKRRMAMELLAGFPVGQAIPALSKLMRRPAMPLSARAATCLALGKAASTGKRGKAMRALHHGLSATDAGVRAACARGAAVAAGAGVTNRLVYWKAVTLMKDRDNRVRAGATLAAARLEPKQFSKALYLLSRERSPGVLAALADGLARVPGKLAYARLVRLARHASADVRRRAAASLLRRSEAPARQIVAKMMTDKDLGVRLVALAVVDDTAAMARLLDSPVPRVRAAALSRLVRARGKAQMLSDLVARLARSKGQLVEQVRLAKAWLRR